MRPFRFGFRWMISLAASCLSFASSGIALAVDTVGVSVLENAIEPGITPARVYIPEQNGSFRISRSGTSGNLKVIYSYLSTGGTAYTYDTDAQDYFDRIAANGGTINDGTKAAVNQLVVYLKAHNLWTEMKRISPRVGNQLAAALVPLKNTIGGTLDVATGYVDADYTLAGGLKGDIFTKSIDTGINLQTAYSVDNDISFGLYVRDNVGATDQNGITSYEQLFDIWASDGPGFDGTGTVPTIGMETAHWLGAIRTVGRLSAFTGH